MAQPIRHTEILEQVGGRNYWQGVRSVLIYRANMELESIALYDHVWPGMSGDNAPVCKRTRAVGRPSEIDKLAMILAYYETRRRPGKARLLTTTTSYYEEITREPGDTARIITGPDPLYNWSFRQIVKGTNKAPAYRTQLRLETAYWRSDFSLANVLSIERSVNDAELELVGFGTVGAQTLWCPGVWTNSEYGGDIVDVTYLFNWSGLDETWNEQIDTQIGSWVTTRLPVLDSSDTDTDETRDAIVFRPGKKWVKSGDDWNLEDADVEPRAGFRVKSFDVLQGLTQW